MNEPTILSHLPFENHSMKAEASLLLDPQMWASIYMVFTGLVGFGMNIAPRFVAKVHGGEKYLNKQALFTCGQVGAGHLSTFFFFFCMFVERVSLFKAIQVSYAFWIYHQSRVAVNAGLKDASIHWGTVGIFGFLVVAMDVFSEVWALRLIQGSAAFWVAQGLFLVLAPVSAGESWKLSFGNPIDDETTPLGLTLGRAMGFWLVTAGLTTGSMAMGGTIEQAMVYAAVSFVSWEVSGILTGEYQRAGIKILPIIGGIAFHVVVVYVILA